MEVMSQEFKVLSLRSRENSCFGEYMYILGHSASSYGHAHHRVHGRCCCRTTIMHVLILLLLNDTVEREMSGRTINLDC